ncbi:MAG: hypothetical protein EPN88_10525 [Bacteroidetes bacterium]|nr:MAG: hypothetical protein EPN88_10525 [Bacteroidota bacterium]
MTTRKIRHLKSDFGPRKLPLPKGLEFLKGFNFYAIIEDNSGSRKKRLIEVHSSSLKKYIENVSELKNQLSNNEHEIESITLENNEINSQLQEAVAVLVKASEYIKALEYNNEILRENLEKYPDLFHEKSIPNYSELIAKSVHKFNLQGFEGGLPSLGKRK